MKALTFILFVLFFAVKDARSQQVVADTTLTKEFLQYQQNGKFEQAHQLLDSAASKMLTVEMLKNVWTSQINTAFGNYVNSITESEQDESDKHIVNEKCHFSKAIVTLKFTFSKSNKILSFVVAATTPVTDK